MAGLLTNRIGPLPTWGWLGIATAGGGAFYLWHKSKSGGQPPAEGEADVPDYVFQNYNEMPPEQPAPRPGRPDPGGPIRGKRPEPVPVKHLGGDKYRVGSAADLFFLAKRFGITERELVRANPQLRKYVGTGKGIPSGTVIHVPAHARHRND